MATQVESVQAAQVAALVEAQSQARASISDQVAEFLRRLWAALSVQDRYNDARVAEFTAQAAQIVQQGRVATASVTDAYLGEVFNLMDIPRETSPLDVTDQPRGIPLEDEMLRGVKDFRRFREAGMDELVAGERALARDLKIADYDLGLAMRETTQRRFSDSVSTRGYRRVIRPELSRTGVCGLCIAASHRVYRSDALLPLHANCKCEVLPVAGLDPGRLVNDADLRMVYDSVDSNTRDKLKQARFQVNEHGQLGPVLSLKGQNFRGPGDVRSVAS